MKEIISKELLSEVLGIDERLCRIDEVIDNTLFFYTFINVGEVQHYINIYELAYKCKEWLHNMEEDFSIEYTTTAKHLKYVRLHFQNRYASKHYSEQYQTELEAIFKACQWILEKLEKQDER